MPALRKQNDRRRGNAIVEFALSGGLLITMALGTYQFGYGLYVYDTLQSAVRNGARYASKRSYKSSSNACVDKIVTSIRNMTVYGDPTPEAGADAVVRGLTTSKVSVSYTKDANGVPYEVTVTISNFDIETVLNTFHFNEQPYTKLPYLGRYAPSECD